MAYDLLALQNRMKRDPEGYRDEFLQQTRHFMTSLQIFKLQPLAKAGKAQTQQSAIFDHTGGAAPASAEAKKGGRGGSDPQSGADSAAATGQGPLQSRRIQEFCALIAFLSHASSIYKAEVAALNIPQEIYALLFDHCEGLDAFLRKTLVQALILMQNRGVLQRSELLPALFRCFRCADKELRRSVFTHIVTDLHKLSKTSPPTHVVSSLLKLLFSLMNDDHPGVSLKAMQVLVELWKRNTWASDKVANAISNMCFGTDDKLVSAALYFFLGNYDTSDEDDADTRRDLLAKKKELAAVASGLKHSRKKQKKQRMIDREQKKLSQIERDLEGDDDDEDDEAAERRRRASAVNANPLMMLHDPQHFVERLFYKLKTSRETFATRMLLMEVISKLIGMHKLLLFNFFPFIQRYLQPHQRYVNQLLAFAARATHSLVPPEVIAPLIKVLASNFVTDRSTPEVMAVGINAIREVCARQPLVMTEELLHDLSEYAKHKNKGIVTATRSLIGVFRQLNPALLKRKDRGRDGQLSLLLQKGDDDVARAAREEAASKLEFGATRLHRDVDGAALLAEAGLLEAAARGDADDDAAWGDHDFEDDFLADNAVLDDDDEPEIVPKKLLKKFHKARGREKKMIMEEIIQRGYILPGGSSFARARAALGYGDDGDEDDDDEDEDEDGEIDGETYDMDEIERMIASGELVADEDDDEDGDDDEDDYDEDFELDDEVEIDADQFDRLFGGEGDDADEGDIEEVLAAVGTAAELDDALLASDDEAEADSDDDEEDGEWDMDMLEGDEDEMEMEMDSDEEDAEVDSDDDEEEEEEVKPKGAAAAKKLAAADAKKKSVTFASGPAPSKEEPTAQLAKPAATYRILTPADFARIEELKKKRLLEGLRGERKRQRSTIVEDLVTEERRIQGLARGTYTDLDGDDLVSYQKKRKMEREDRIAHTQEGRDILKEGRLSYGHKLKDNARGLTNEEKLKTKNFQMVKHSRKVKAKSVRGISEKQRTSAAHADTMKKMSKNLKKKMSRRV